jgi:cell division protein FtsI/penicillin-binding protein 2
MIGHTKVQPWKFSNIYSLAIGEGENLVVPIQMANFAATIANRGFYYTPHLLKPLAKKENHYRNTPSVIIRASIRLTLL